MRVRHYFPKTALALVGVLSFAGCFKSPASTSELRCTDSQYCPTHFSCIRPDAQMVGHCEPSRDDAGATLDGDQGTRDGAPDVSLADVSSRVDAWPDLVVDADRPSENPVDATDTALGGSGGTSATGGSSGGSVAGSGGRGGSGGAAGAGGTGGQSGTGGLTGGSSGATGGKGGAGGGGSGGAAGGDGCATCTGACQSCVDGKCVLSKSGTVCRGAINECDEAEKCTGDSAQCPTDAFKPATTSCASASCLGNQFTEARHCSGTAATCAPAASPKNCGKYTCSDAGCKTTCGGAADCQSPSVCNPDLKTCGGPYYTSVSVGGQHTCAVVSDGTVRCWGRNEGGELGMGQKADQSSPPDPTVFAVQNLSNATSVRANLNRSCGILAEKTVSCWGWGAGGRLGDNTSTVRAYPGPVPGLANVSDLSLGTDHACVVFTSGAVSSVSCWGGNGSGQAGLDPATSSVVPTPQTISGFTNVLQVSGGVNHSCMVLKTGQVLCWGANDSGQLGGGPGDAAFSPKLVDWATNVASVFAGATFTCACLKSGEVQCWGLLPGALSSTQLLLSPTSVPGLANTTSLVQIDTKICGVTPTGTISCVESETSSATQIAGLADVKMLSAAGHACALVKGGTVKCWGSNLYGQLGDETTNDSDTPVTAKGP